MQSGGRGRGGDEKADWVLNVRTIYIQEVLNFVFTRMCVREREGVRSFWRAGPKTYIRGHGREVAKSVCVCVWCAWLSDAVGLESRSCVRVYCRPTLSFQKFRKTCLGASFDEFATNKSRRENGQGLPHATFHCLSPNLYHSRRTD